MSGRINSTLVAMNTLYSEQAVTVNDAASLDALFARYRRVLVRYFERRGFSVDVAEDHVQDLFVLSLIHI